LIIPTAFAQQPPSPPPAPDYGPPITLEQAEKVADAALTEAKKGPYPMAITVVGPSGDLVYFVRMDGTAHASLTISQHKARAAATFKRPTKLYEDRVAGGGIGVTVLTLDGVIASAGGIPLMSGGKIIGAIGVSGGPTGAIDSGPAQAGADALKKALGFTDQHQGSLNFLPSRVIHDCPSS
jgi:glc operon protein GlcG